MELAADNGNKRQRTHRLLTTNERVVEQVKQLMGSPVWPAIKANLENSKLTGAQMFAGSGSPAVWTASLSQALMEIAGIK